MSDRFIKSFKPKATGRPLRKAKVKLKEYTETNITETVEYMCNGNTFDDYKKFKAYQADRRKRYEPGDRSTIGYKLTKKVFVTTLREEL